jgi:mono/diheme cytochrome c family protein
VRARSEAVAGTPLARGAAQEATNMRSIASFVFLAVLAGSSLARAEVDKKTEKTWKSKCASCHGVDGKAQTDQGKKFGIKDYSTAEFHAGQTDADLKKAIVDGKGQNMPAYKDLGEQGDQLVQLIRSFKK